MPLYKGWLDHCEKWGPPIHVSVAALLGIVKTKAEKTRPSPKGRRGLPPAPEPPGAAVEEHSGPVPISRDPQGFIDLFTAAGGRAQ